MTISMETVELKYYPDPILKQKCVDVDPLDPDLPAVLDKMVAFMYMFGGQGLAAPQVGLPWNVMVVDCGADNEPRALVNPRLESVEETMIESEEACLSLPGIKGKVERHKTIIISCCVPKSEERVTITLSGRDAKIFQHEYDHLQGIVYLDRMKPVAKMMAKKKYLKHKDEVLTLRKQNKDLRLKAKDLENLIKKFKTNVADVQEEVKEATNVSTEDSCNVNECVSRSERDGGCPGVSPQ